MRLGTLCGQWVERCFSSQGISDIQGLKWTAGKKTSRGGGGGENELYHTHIGFLPRPMRGEVTSCWGEKNAPCQTWHLYVFSEWTLRGPVNFSMPSNLYVGMYLQRYINMLFYSKDPTLLKPNSSRGGWYHFLYKERVLVLSLEDMSEERSWLRMCRRPQFQEAEMSVCHYHLVSRDH